MKRGYKGTMAFILAPITAVNLPFAELFASETNQTAVVSQKNTDEILEHDFFQDGSTGHTYQYFNSNSDNNWGGHTAGQAGTYKGIVKVTRLKIGGTATDALRLNWNRNSKAFGYIVEQY